MGRYISNGTMGGIWMERWCFRCVNDHKFSHVPDGDGADGCPIIMRMSLDDVCPELIDHSDAPDYDWRRGWSPDDLECRMFERCPCQDDPGWEPPEPPPPLDPNQGLLFDVVHQTPGLPMQVIMDPVPEKVAP